ncbi:protein-disulfide reductase DsbD family protein [Hahella ganghwensis]|uniref:protein-disulfide reductase DsbD family protein n=1 Tax=Hahella ganghwensis TaxID=286420 RepID=UPI00037952CA|nr:protein-disulfide reductase DsbD [Hahella ganghwensis]
MMLRTLFALLLCLPALVYAEFNLGESSDALQEPDFLPVDEAYVFTSSVEGNDLVLHWKIADGYYLYQNRMKVTPATSDASVGEFQYAQEGKEKDDPYFGLVKVFYHEAEFRVPVSAASGQEVEFTVGYQGCADAGLCYPPQKRPALFIAPDATTNGISSTGSDTTPQNGGSGSKAFTTEATSLTGLFLAIISAFAGGLILNLMPCVFPVLSLKAFKLAKASGIERREHKFQALAYTAGVVALFLSIATALIVLRAGGESVGWGFQLQSPWFVGLMVYILFLLGLSLSGFIEFGTSLMGAGESLTTKGGKRGAFFTGALAVLVASPCTAPFMGTAMGYAITQPPAVSLTIFASLGLGMASPFLAIAYIPTLAKALPKPGAWMDTFKQILAFPLYLSALWLLWVLGRQTGVNGMTWVLAGLIALTFAAWIHRRARSLSGAAKWFERAFAASAGVFAIWVLTTTTTPQRIEQAAAFQQDAIEQYRNEGKTVFVNVTADWCVSCLVNENAVLSQSPVAEVLASEEVAYIKGDWTNSDPLITDYLASFGRNGVPLYVVYRSGQDPIVLPQILTTSTVMDALSSIN